MTGFINKRYIDKKCPLCLDRMFEQEDNKGRAFNQCDNVECQYWEWKNKKKQMRLFER